MSFSAVQEGKCLALKIVFSNALRQPKLPVKKIRLDIQDIPIICEVLVSGSA